MQSWLFDLGNTRLKMAPLHDDGAIGEVVAVPHGGEGFGPPLEAALPGHVDVAHVAAVAGPALRLQLSRALAARCRRISHAATVARLGRLQVGYPEPARLGVDRFLALLAASADGGGAALVCGVGTALTLDLVDAEGRHHGGLIAPSPTLMREALHARAAHLPAEGGVATAFATDTADALASGCEGAAVALVRERMDRARDLLGDVPRLLLHGGGAAAFVTELPGARMRPLLVLEGLSEWARAQATP